jgi:hypothetical protein
MSVLAYPKGVAPPGLKSNHSELLSNNPSDYPRNHLVLVGARVGELSPFGEFTGNVGVVLAATTVISVNKSGFTENVTYEIEFENGRQVLWQPLQLFRKSVVLACSLHAFT